MNRNIFVTGGAGYIGTHTCVELLNAGYQVTVFDNYCNSKPEALNRVERITGKTLTRVQGDVRDGAALTAARCLCGRCIVAFWCAALLQPGGCACQWLDWRRPTGRPQ